MAELEPFQHTGPFETRGALLVMLGLSAEQKVLGVSAVSVGKADDGRIGL